MALIPWAKVEHMLKECAPRDYHVSLKTHNRCVQILSSGLTYPSLPKVPQIKAQHIRKLAKALGIYDCAKRVLGQALSG